MTYSTLEKLEIIVKAADDRLAQEIMVLDVSAMTPLAEYFMICHARNEKQLSAIVDAIAEACHDHQIPVKNIEGKDGGKWILMDIHDIVVHVFHYAERGHYNLEKVWLDAPMVDVTSWIN